MLSVGKVKTVRKRIWYLALWLGASAALLAPPARADAAAEARFHDERARSAFAARDYETALAEFFVVRRLIPNPRVDFNVALCFERLGREAEAFTHFDGFLADSSSRAPELAELRGYAEAALARIAPRVALLEIITTPPGATIYLDRRELGAYGRSPCRLAVAPGEHRVRVELDGHRPEEAGIVARVGERRTITLAPERVVGRLEVTAVGAGKVRVLDPRGVTVARGPAPLHAELPPGPYEIEVTAAGHEPWRGVAQVAAEDVVRRQAVPLPSPDALGDLAVTSNVPGAMIELDGRPAGFSPVVLTGLAPGEHRLHVTSEELVPWAGPVAVNAGERTWVTVSLDEPASTVRSPLTWAFGGVAIATGLVGATMAVVAADRRAEFGDAAEEERAAIREGGRSANLTADVLLGVSAASLATAVILYVRTARSRGGQSEASIARDAR